MIALTENLGTPATLGEIETQCRNYEGASADLEALITALEEDLDAVKKKHLSKIKKQAAIVARLEANLHSTIEGAPGLFTKPRTITAHGIKVGLTTSPGKMEFDDEATVVAMIKKFRKDDADLFIRKTEEVNKDALKTLDADELKRIGCRIEGAGDVVVLKRVAGEVEKLINKLMTRMVEAMVEGEA